MDPLSLLRESITTNKGTVPVVGDEVIFGDIRINKEEETAWKARGRISRGGGQAYYKLSELAVLMENATLPHNDYIRKMGVLKLPSFVSKLDFDDLIQYLQGKTATSDQIDPSRLIPRSSSAIPAGGIKRPASFIGGGPLKFGRLPSDGAIGLRFGDFARNSGIDGQGLADLEQVLEAKQRRRRALKEGGQAGPYDAELGKLDEEMHRVLKSNEQLVNDRNSVLLTPAADYKMVLDIIEALQKKSKDPSSSKVGGSSGRKPLLSHHHAPPPPAPSSSSSSRHPSASTSGTRPRAALEPIIIVPSDPSALINMTNVADYLENAHFLGPQDKSKSRDAVKRVKELTITKTIDDRPIKFKVIDNPVWLQPGEWEAVVAVFSNGKSWQFSEWKYNTPVDLFHRCLGAVVHYDDEPLRGEVKGWNVKFYKVNRGKRHMDGLAVSSFWIHLTEWLKVHKPAVLKGSSSSSSSSTSHRR